VRPSTLLCSLFCLGFAYGSAQKINPDSLAYLLKHDKDLAELDSLLNSGERTNILSLIDSLVQLSGARLPSQLLLRAGYSSNLTSQARALGFDQFGVTYGASYYHRSGAYLDVSGYWSPEFAPKHYLTVASVGYLQPWSKRLMSMVEYSHFFYTYRGPETDIPFTDNVSVSNFLDFKYASLRLDYSFLFGRDTGHRLMPGFVLNLRKETWWGLDRIAFNPGYTLILGNDEYEVVTSGMERLRRVIRRLPTEYPITGFGIMSHNFVFPLSLTKKSWNVIASYSLVLPRKVVTPIETDPTGFFSLGLSKTFNLK
jgi:hypothetical protein